MKEHLQLFSAFCRIGAFTFGGGYAMLPMLQREIVWRYAWASEEELLNYFAIGQCTPGIIAVNTATFVGYKRKGICGAVTATAGLVFPSFVIITLLAAFLQNFAHLPLIQHAFAGVRAAVAMLILNAVLKLQKTSVADTLSAVIFAFIFCAGLFFKTSPIIMVAGAACAGLFLYGARA